MYLERVDGPVLIEKRAVFDGTIDENRVNEPFAAVGQLFEHVNIHGIDDLGRYDVDGPGFARHRVDMKDLLGCRWHCCRELGRVKRQLIERGPSCQRCAHGLEWNA